MTIVRRRPAAGAGRSGWTLFGFGSDIRRRKDYTGYHRDPLADRLSRPAGARRLPRALGACTLSDVMRGSFVLRRPARAWAFAALLGLIVAAPDARGDDAGAVASGD